MFASSPPSRTQLLQSAQALCNAFAAKADVDTLLSHFSSTHQITAIEHGLPYLAPYFDRPFTGRTGPTSVAAYLNLLQEHLTYDTMTFSSWIVDDEAQRVACKGRARFTWISGDVKGQTWEEEFACILDFDQSAKVTDYQVFADTGAAYLGRRGELTKLTPEERGEVRPVAVGSSGALRRCSGTLHPAIPSTGCPSASPREVR